MIQATKSRHCVTTKEIVPTKPPIASVMAELDPKNWTGS
jgi:hypothetical protein